LDPSGLYRWDHALPLGAQVELFDVQGQIIQGRIMPGDGSCTVDLRGLPAAMYVARASSNDQVRSFKLMRP
jgi:hypothetical protein